MTRAKRIVEIAIGFTICSAVTGSIKALYKHATSETVMCHPAIVEIIGK